MLREIGKRETEVAALQARCVRRLGLADPGPAGRRPDDIGSTPWAAWMTSWISSDFWWTRRART